MKRAEKQEKSGKSGIMSVSPKALIDWLASPALVFFLMPVLMALLVAGTIAQRPMGLYDAQTMFFSSFLFWAGPVPLPGGFTLIAVISFGLLIKFIFKSDWNWRKAGINLSHLGVLVILLGGLLTALKAEEGYMVIPEGQQSASVLDYHQRELLVLDGNKIIASVPHQKIHKGHTLSFANIPFDILVADHCRNCKINLREEKPQGYAPESLTGMAQFMAIESTALEKEDEANLYGATLQIDGKIYVVFEAMPKPIAIEKDGKTYELIYSKHQRHLPFALHLNDFVRTLYPGTNTPRSYHSDISVIDAGASWPVRIEMNKPLRYKGYTFFQSSFAQNEDKNATILSVVKNGGWLFPYIGTLIVAVGLLMHCFIMMAQRRKK